jgi:hypothetical protein
MGSSEHRRTQRQVVDRIRTHNFLLDIDSASDMVKEGALNLQTQLNNALKLLSDDLYSKKSHFVLELVQNADDNHYASGVTPHLELHVTPHRLVVVNNEVGFSEANVKAICSVGASSKTRQKSGYIGEKGIGFKSVFTVSDAPEIHSNGFHFKFDRTADDNLLGYVVPHWCEPPADIESDCTTIILPASKSYEFGADTLVDLDARLLLFLNKLRQLTLVHNSQRTSYCREDEGGVSKLSTIRDSGGDDAQSEELRYVRVELTLLMKDQFADEKRPGIEHSKVVLAFPVDEAGVAKPETTSHVFAYLPIRQMGFRFPIQADFILNSSREEILADRPWNIMLRAGVAEVFSMAVETFKKFDSLALSYLKYIPAEGEVINPFFRSLRTSIITKLAGARSLLSTSGEWKQPSELRIASKSFQAIFPSKLALKLFGFDYIDPRVQGGNELFRSLGAKDAQLSDILSIFSVHGEWLRKQPLDWRARFFGYIADNQQQLLDEGILKCPCLPISDGSYVVPAQSNVFFPFGKTKKYGFESELVFIDNELYEEALKYSVRVVELFAGMKVRTDEPYDLVNAHILPRHKGEAWKTSEHKALVGHLRYVKDKLQEYLESALAHGKSEAQAFQVLREGMWIGTKRNVEGTWWFSRVGDLYLSKEYKPRFCMESNVGEALDATKLLSPDYLAGKVKNPDVEAESWRQFFTQLGIRSAPAVESDGYDWKCSDELQILLDSPNHGVRRATLECMNAHWSNYAGHLTFTFTAGRSIHGPKDTKFALSLRATQAPTKKRSSVSLAEAYYPTTELRTLLGDGLPYVDAELSSEMLDACRVTYSLDARALVKRLKQLKDGSGGTTRQIQAIYRALDERLWHSDSAYIRQAFNSDGLIQITGAHKGWFKPSEVAWRSNGAFLDSLYPPIQSLYRDFSKFFVDKLGIPIELPTVKRVEALTQLGKIADPDDRKREALTIYLRANRDLGPRFGREQQAPAWLETFRSEAVFIDQRGEVVFNDQYLFANDSPVIAALFEGEECLSFLAVPSQEVPRLSRLLDAVEVPRLSETVKLEVCNASSGEINQDLTARIRCSVPFFARALYAKRPEEFEVALSEGRFAQLREFEVAEVPQVEMVVSLLAFSSETTADVALSARRLLYRTGARSVKDMMAVEISKFLATTTDLADTFARILLENDPDSIEDFFKVRSVGVLPPDLLSALEGSTGPTIDDAEGGVFDESSARQIGENEPIEEQATRGDGSELAEAYGEQSQRRFASSSRPEPFSSDGHGERGRIPEIKEAMSPREESLSIRSPIVRLSTPPVLSIPAPNLRTPGATAPRVEGGEPEAANVLQSSPNTSSSREKGLLGSSRAPNFGRHDAGGHGIYASVQPDPIERSRVYGPGSGQPPKSRSYARPRRGYKQIPKTKTGRLLSYAEGPREVGNSNPADDPAKAAAREAIGHAAVEYFMATQSQRWKSLTEMPHNNPGFDVLAITHDDQEEFIEVKGQSGAWTEHGVALTPTELMTAQQKGERYLLCVVEHALEDRCRQLYLLRNPYGMTQQFRFDVGWKSAAESAYSAPLIPERGMYIEMPGVGYGQVLSVRGKGRFFNLHVILDDGRQVNKPFNPVKMKLSKEPMWQG